MKSIIFILITLIPAFVQAQKIKSTEVDKFNGSKTVSTTEESLVTTMGYTQVRVQGYVFYGKDSSKQTSLFFILKPPYTGSMKEGDKVILLTAKGESIAMPYSGKYDLFTSGQTAIFAATAEKEQLEAITAAKITAVRFDISPRIDYDIKEKKQDVLPNLCRLLLEN